MAEENAEQQNTDAAAGGEAVSANDKKKKISQMTASEVEAKLKDVQANMGGLTSQYAQQLLRRKDELSA